MSPVSLWLMTRNPDLKERWHRWLSEQGWSVVDVPPSGRPPGPGPLLVDADLLKGKDPSAVRDLGAPQTPVIVFGEPKDASDESVIGWLREGADDFIPASVHSRLLNAKIEAHVRRLPGMERGVLYAPRRSVKADVRRGLAWTRSPEGRWKLTPALTGTEHRLLCLLLAEPETPLERGVLVERLWGEKAADVYSGTLTQHVMSLRRKLGESGAAVRTLYGRGYMFIEPA